MTVHTTYYAALEHDKVEPSETDFVAGVVRHPQEWTNDLVDRNLPDLAPPERLLDAYKTVEDAAEQDDDVHEPRRIAWESTRFEERYQDYLTSANLSSVLGTLRAREHGGDIWLVCYEKDPAYCHRRLLANELTRGREEEPVHHPEPGVDDTTEKIVADARLEDFQEGRA